MGRDNMFDILSIQKQGSWRDLNTQKNHPKFSRTCSLRASKFRFCFCWLTPAIFFPHPVLVRLFTTLTVLNVVLSVTVEFLLKADSEYPEHVGLKLTLATPGNSLRYYTHWSAHQSLALALPKERAPVNSQQ